MKSFKELRKDPHRPSAMDPAEYVFVGAADDHPGDGYLEIRHDVLARHGVETGSSDRHSFTNVPFYDANEEGRPNYRCHHCGKHGSNIRYFCFYLHKPTKQVIVVGQICAERFDLGTKEERRFQKRAEEARRREAEGNWKTHHQAEYDFLKAYDTAHSRGGKYVEFMESLWDRVQRFGSLTDPQVAALHKWMNRRQDWMPDGDRHQGVVTHTDDPPTDKQIKMVADLCQQLEELPADLTGLTRIEVSNMINVLRGRLQMEGKAGMHRRAPATSPQLSYINLLMEEREMDLEARRKARRLLDEGLTKDQAIAWISKLKTLPMIEEKS